MSPVDRTDAEPPTSEITTEDHVVWGGRRNVLARVEWGFVVSSWLACLVAAILLGIVLGFVTSLVTDSSLTGERNSELGALTLAASMATFVGFALMMARRLPRVAHDRLTNSMAVAVLHLAVAAILLGLEGLSRLVFDGGVSSALGGGWTDEAGNAFALVERSSIAAILGCGLAVGLVPARGERPQQTQTGVTRQDRQL